MEGRFANCFLKYRGAKGDFPCYCQTKRPELVIEAFVLQQQRQQKWQAMSSPLLSFAPALFSEPCVVGKFYIHVMSNNLKRPRVNLPFNESHIYERTLTSKSQMSQNEHSSQQVASNFQMTSKWTGQLLQETEDTQPVWVRLELESIPAIAGVGWTGEMCSPPYPPWLIKRKCESLLWFAPEVTQNCSRSVRIDEMVLFMVWNLMNSDWKRSKRLIVLSFFSAQFGWGNAGVIQVFQNCNLDQLGIFWTQHKYI